MTLPRLPLAIHTNVAELLDQLRAAQLAEFGDGASFLRRERKGRFYWYVRSRQTQGDRPERYLGPETPELLETIESAKAAKTAAGDRRLLVRSLRAAGLHAPDDRTGRTLKAMARAGVFRLRAAVVGTVAFQTYGSALGFVLPSQAVRTGDLDIAQDRGISVTIDDGLDRPFLDMLRTADPTFSPVPKLGPSKSATYRTPDGYAVDVLTTSRHAGDEETSRLDALNTDATPLRFLDFLLRETVETVVLYDDGVLVRVPTPARYAVHKLIVSRKRGQANPKRRKDLEQAQALIHALAHDDPFALREAYAEARGRGEAWREPLDQAVSLLPSEARAALEG
ncbi:nucleotidyltransferase family protein [Caulobacter sp.]|uniref:nucleotidyltransferase family protein n=1 Tax=Caulobacter sp. TaxID=78 RepID=UPI002B4A0078|nr:GSU2403 family nucleotidyltransferase fold protein [Caulobacter sp.]HJV42720.1 GSU2403 family nucleotidyltransferase fold protein [Caulobacter sp.]